MFKFLTRRLSTGKPVGYGLHSDVLRKAAILHVDMIESTRRVRNNPLLAHRQIQQMHLRLQHIGRMHNAIPRELRGDAAVIEFSDVADAVLAAQAIHAVHDAMNNSRLGRINPQMRTGISYGELVGEEMITGEAVIRAQRLEQLSTPGQVLLDQSAVDQLLPTSQFRLQHLSTEILKGFSEPIAVYQALASADSGYLYCSYLRALACPN